MSFESPQQTFTIKTEDDLQRMKYSELKKWLSKIGAASRVTRSANKQILIKIILDYQLDFPSKFVDNDSNDDNKHDTTIDKDDLSESKSKSNYNDHNINTKENLPSKLLQLNLEIDSFKSLEELSQLSFQALRDYCKQHNFFQSKNSQFFSSKYELISGIFNHQLLLMNRNSNHSDLSVSSLNYKNIEYYDIINYYVKLYDLFHKWPIDLSNLIIQRFSMARHGSLLILKNETVTLQSDFIYEFDDIIIENGGKLTVTKWYNKNNKLPPQLINIINNTNKKNQQQSKKYNTKNNSNNNNNNSNAKTNDSENDTVTTTNVNKIKNTENKDECKENFQNINNEKNEHKTDDVKSLLPLIEENIDMKGGKLYLKVFDTISIGTDTSSGSIDLSGCGYKGGSCYFGETFEELNNMISTDSEIGFYGESYQRASNFKSSHNNLGGGGASNKFTNGGNAGYGTNGELNVRRNRTYYRSRNTTYGGIIYGENDWLDELYLGSGGGGNGSRYVNSNSNNNRIIYPGFGGDGGGSLRFVCKNLVINKLGSIKCNGKVGFIGYNRHYGGNGSGGTIFGQIKNNFINNGQIISLQNRMNGVDEINGNGRIGFQLYGNNDNDKEKVKEKDKKLKEMRSIQIGTVKPKPLLF